MAGCFAAWLGLMSKLHAGLSNGLGRIGYNSATRPCTTVSLCLLMALLCGAGFARFEVETDGPSLWTPQKSPAFLNREYVGENWGGDPIVLRILVEAKQRGENALTVGAFREALEVVHDVFNLTADGKSWQDLCLRDVEGKCAPYGVPSFFGWDMARFEAEVSSDADLLAAVSAEVYPDTRQPVDREAIFGQLRFDGSQIASAAVWRMDLLLDGANPREHTREWEKAFVDHFAASDYAEVGQRWEHVHLEVWASGRSVDDELARSISGDILFFAMAYNFLVIACSLMLGHPCRCASSRKMLGAADFFVVIFGVIAGYGLASGFGVPFTSLQQILPFILVGIGVDDAYVITAAFDRTDRSKPIEDRMRQALMSEGMSVTLTSLTDIMAFLAGSSASFPAVSHFCVYASLSLVFIYSFHITAFCSLLALDERRQLAGRPEVLCCLPPRSLVTPVEEDKQGESPGERLMESYARIITRNIFVKLGIVSVFLSSTGLCFWFAAEQTDTEFDLMDLAPDDSYMRNFFLTEEEYWGSDSSGHHRRVHLYVDNVDAGSASVQSELMQAEDNLLAVPCINERAGIESWIRRFTAWVSANRAQWSASDFQSAGGVEYLSGPAFYTALDTWLANCSLGCHFKNDVKFGGGVVSTARVGVRQKTMTRSDDQADCLTQIEAFNEETSKKLPGAFAFTDVYIFYHQYRTIRAELFFTTGMCFAAVLVVSSVIISHPAAVLLIFGVILLVFIDLLGCIPLAGVSLNSISMINMVMAIGLVVDYSMHICHSFMSQDPLTSRDERAVKAMKQIGLPVAKGILSTFVAIMPLALASSEVFRVFFKMFLAILIVGGSHGLVLMPVLLSMFGPAAVSAETQKTASTVVGAIPDEQN